MFAVFAVFAVFALGFDLLYPLQTGIFITVRIITDYLPKVVMKPSENEYASTNEYACI